MNQNHLNYKNYIKQEDLSGGLAYECTECGSIGTKVHVHNNRASMSPWTSRKGASGRDVLTPTDPDATWLCPSCFASLKLVAVSTKKRPRKEHYNMRTRTPGQNTFICTKCSRRGLNIYELDRAAALSNNLDINPLVDSWLCPACLSKVTDEKQVAPVDNIYEGLTVFPLLNGLPQ